MDICLLLVALLHVFFMAGELLPWQCPFILKKAGTTLPPIPALSKNEVGVSDGKFTTEQLSLVAALVHNAGIYNGIVAGGLLWAAFVGDPGHDVARIMLIGAAAAGIFGTITLKSGIPAIQAGLSPLCLYRLVAA
ncbi:MAG: DUF1304 family protein [Nitrospira sp.]|nr:DUF1304 family protein [Nitrospira sp.]